MAFSDERDYSEESVNQRLMEEGDVCTQHTGPWTAGMCYVHEDDLDSIYEMRSARGEEIECERCGGTYDPKKSQRSY